VLQGAGGRGGPPGQQAVFLQDRPLPDQGQNKGSGGSVHPLPGLKSKPVMVKLEKIEVDWRNGRFMNNKLQRLINRLYNKMEL